MKLNQALEATPRKNLRNEQDSKPHPNSYVMWTKPSVTHLVESGLVGH